MMTRRDPVRRPSVARHRGGGRARARRARASPTCSRPSAGLQPIDVELDGARAARLDAAGAGRVRRRSSIPARCSAAVGLDGARRRSRRCPCQVVSTGVAAGDRAACATPRALRPRAARLRPHRARCSRPHDAIVALPRRRRPGGGHARARARSCARPRSARTRPPARPPARCAPTWPRGRASSGSRSTRASRWAGRAGWSPRSRAIACAWAATWSSWSRAPSTLDA